MSDGSMATSAPLLMRTPVRPAADRQRVGEGTRGEGAVGGRVSPTPSRSIDEEIAELKRWVQLASRRTPSSTPAKSSYAAARGRPHYAVISPSS